MKKIIGFGCFSATVVFVSLLGGSNISCNKPTACLGVVTVHDTLNNPIDSAIVSLSCTNPPGQVGSQGYTDPNGNCNFDFKLPAIFNVKATGKVGNKAVTGTGIIQLQPGETATYTVTAR